MPPADVDAEWRIQGGNGPLLQDVEFDGYIGIADDLDNIHVPWHVLPHKAAADQAVGKG